MNKITLLAGVALAAAAAAPASAQNGIFNSTTTTLPTFAFGAGNSSYTLTNAPVTYFTGTGQAAVGTPGTVTLSGTGLVAGSQYTYASTTLSFTPSAGAGFTETGATNVNQYNGFTTFSAVGGTLSNGDRLNLSYSPLATPPVPEAGTVVSLGVLLALGGLAVLRRKSAVRAS